GYLDIGGCRHEAVTVVKSANIRSRYDSLSRRLHVTRISNISGVLVLRRVRASLAKYWGRESVDSDNRKQTERRDHTYTTLHKIRTPYQPLLEKRCQDGAAQLD